MLDLLLVHPGGQQQVYQSLARELTAIEPPVWCGFIAGYARRFGYSVKILDTNAEGLTPENTSRKVAELSPRLVSVVVYGHQPSASTQHMPAAGAIARAIKDRVPEQKVLMVGGHVAALPERTLQEEAVDFVSSGEGPKTVAALLEMLKVGADDWSRVPDLWYRKNVPPSPCLLPPEGGEDSATKKDGSAALFGGKGEGVIRYTFPAALIQDLDCEMPEPAWDLLPMHRYRSHNWHAFGLTDRKPYASIYTSLGCPYRCHFCCIQAPFKAGEKALGYKPSVNSYRLWSADRVLATIDHLVERYGVRHLKIADEMFILNEGHVNAICEKLIERDYGLNIWAYARVDTIKLEQLPILKRAGFRWLALGIESANEHVREDVAKPFCQESIRKTIQQIQDAGIYVIANYIFGLPEDTLETMQETLDLAMELNTEFANFYCAMAYPGSAIYEQALREGRPLPKTWAGYSQHSKDAFPLPTKTLSSCEVLEFRDKAFVCYFSRLAYQAMIERKFGVRARQEIEAMLAIPMERAHPEMMESPR